MIYSWCLPSRTVLRAARRVGWRAWKWKRREFSKWERMQNIYLNIKWYRLKLSIRHWQNSIACSTKSSLATKNSYLIKDTSDIFLDILVCTLIVKYLDFPISIIGNIYVHRLNQIKIEALNQLTVRICIY